MPGGRRDTWRTMGRMDTNEGTPLDNPRREAYCRERVAGKTQRQAMLSAWPDRARWKPETVDKRASELEARGEVKGRIAELKRAAAAQATAARSEVLAGMSETFRAGIERVRGACGADPLDHTAVNAVTQIGRTLLDELPEDAADGGGRPFLRDFALLIGKDFLRPHRLMAAGEQLEFWMRGGRGSLKSSWASLELVAHVETHPREHAAALMKRKNALRDAVYSQVVWAIHALGLDGDYDMPVSTLRIRKRSTGQLILFAGCDDPSKSKGLKVPFGHIGFAWFEEVDQFRGMSDIRTVMQSVARGGDRTVRVYTYNPPRTRDNWANREADRRLGAGEEVFDSSYADAPPEWLGSQFVADAEALREADPEAYRHEYLGEPVGYGGQVFDRVEFREVTDGEIASFERVLAGQDFGWFPDPWAMTLSEWQPGEHRVVTYYEDGGTRLQPHEMADRAKAALTWPDREGAEPAYHRLRVLSDDASPDRIQAMRDEGVDARAAGKGGLRGMSYRFLQSVTWVIDPARCPNLAREVRAAEFEMDPATGEYSGEYPDGDDHWIDATRYALMGVVAKRGAYRFARKG